MNRTLLVLATHFIDEAVISEYRKMKNTPNVDAVLMIDNTNPKIEFKNRIENKIFFDTSVQCFFVDSKLHEELKLPYFTFNGVGNFGQNMWMNGDYRFYFAKKNFPNYDYYWIVEYDVFCNAENYAGFLDRFKSNLADLLITNFRAEPENSTWYWRRGLEWIYTNTQIYGGLLPIVRLSAHAVDFLYKRRLEHKEIFQNSTDRGKRWIFCELFVATELMNSGFSCESIDEPNVILQNFYLNDERFFLQPDNHLYHPVKSVKSELEKHQKQYTDLFLLFRKVFLTALAEKIISVKNLPCHFDEQFNFVIFAISNGGGDFSLRYEARFFQGKIFISLVFDGKYVDKFPIVNQCNGLNKLQPLQPLKTPTGQMLAYVTPILDNVSQVADAMKILIESTYDILQEKVL